jgi:phospholipid transport system substrate-binding protein
LKRAPSAAVFDRFGPLLNLGACGIVSPSRRPEMIRLERMLSVLVAFLMIALAAPSASAESATDFVKARQNEVISLLQGLKAGAGRDAKIADVLAKMLDYDHLARQSLATHWTELTDAQRTEFKDTLQKLVQRSYERNIKQVLNFDVEYLREETVEPGGVVIVYTRANAKSPKGDDPISIDYRLDRPGGKWRVVDIVTEDSSLVGNYRSQFHRTIQKEGYDALIRKMKNKLAKGDKP